MAATRSTYQIALETTANVAPIKLSEEAIAQLSLTTKAADSAAKAAETTHIHSADAVAKIGKAAKEASVSHRELHEALSLMRVSAGDALGPIGELAHFLSNPYLLAVSGAALAIKMLVEQHEKMLENTRKNIELTEAQTRLFAGAHAEAIRTVAGELAEMADRQKHARDSVDYTSEALTRQIAVQRDVLTTMQASATAAESLYEARVKLLELEGKMTGPAANAAIQSVKEQIQAQKNQAEYAEKVAEANEHVNRAAQASHEAIQLRGQTGAGSALRGDETRLNAAVGVATEIAARLKTDSSAALGVWQQEKARLGISERATPQEIAHLLQGPENQQSRMLFQTAQTTEGASKAEDAHLAKLKIAQELNKKEIDRLDAKADTDEKTNDSELALAVETKRAADVLKQRNDIAAAGAHNLAQVQRRTDLETKQHAGTLTGDEASELRGMTANLRGTRSGLTGIVTPGLIDDARGAMRHFFEDRSRGGLTEEDMMRLHSLLSALIGAHHNTQTDIHNNRALLDDLQGKVEGLLNARGNPP